MSSGIAEEAAPPGVEAACSRDPSARCAGCSEDAAAPDEAAAEARCEDRCEEPAARCEGRCEEPLARCEARCEEPAARCEGRCEAPLACVGPGVSPGWVQGSSMSAEMLPAETIRRATSPDTPQAPSGINPSIPPEMLPAAEATHRPTAPVTPPDTSRPPSGMKDALR